MANNRHRVFLVSIASALSACYMSSETASAAILIGTPAEAPSLPANLTSLGDTAWAYWNSTSTTGVSSMAPTNRKSGTSLISSATAVGGGGNVRGSSAVTGISFSFSDGTSALNGDSVATRGVFNATLNESGVGVAVSVTLPQVQLYKVSVWVSGYNSTNTFTASLSGATTYHDSSFSYVGEKVARLYEFDVKPDHAGDALGLSYVVASPNGSGSTHALIAGVAVDAIPEPAALSIVASLLLLPVAGRPRLRRR